MQREIRTTRKKSGNHRACDHYEQATISLPSKPSKKDRTIASDKYVFGDFHYTKRGRNAAELQESSSSESESGDEDGLHHKSKLKNNKKEENGNDGTEGPPRDMNENQAEGDPKHGDMNENQAEGDPEHGDMNEYQAEGDPEHGDENQVEGINGGKSIASDGNAQETNVTEMEKKRYRVNKPLWYDSKRRSSSSEDAEFVYDLEEESEENISETESSDEDVSSHGEFDEEIWRFAKLTREIEKQNKDQEARISKVAEEIDPQYSGSKSNKTLEVKPESAPGLQRGSKIGERQESQQQPRQESLTDPRRGQPWKESPPSSMGQPWKESPPSSMGQPWKESPPSSMGQPWKESPPSSMEQRLGTQSQQKSRIESPTGPRDETRLGGRPESQPSQKSPGRLRSGFRSDQELRKELQIDERAESERVSPSKSKRSSQRRGRSRSKPRNKQESRRRSKSMEISQMKEMDTHKWWFHGLGYDVEDDTEKSYSWILGPTVYDVVLDVIATYKQLFGKIRNPCGCVEDKISTDESPAPCLNPDTSDIAKPATDRKLSVHPEPKTTPTVTELKMPERLETDIPTPETVTPELPVERTRPAPPLLENVPTFSLETRRPTPLSEAEIPNPSLKEGTPPSETRTPNPSLELRRVTPRSEAELSKPSLEERRPTPPSKSRTPNPSQEIRRPTPPLKAEVPTPSLEERRPTPPSKSRTPNPSQEIRRPTPPLEAEVPTPSLEERRPTPPWKSRTPNPSQEIRRPTPPLEAEVPTPSLEERRPTPPSKSRTPNPSKEISSKDVRPGSEDRSKQRLVEIEKRKSASDEENKKRHKSQASLEVERKEQEAIPSDNKGFELLQKMVDKPGEALGKTAKGPLAPVKIEVKCLGRKSSTKLIKEEKKPAEEKRESLLFSGEEIEVKTQGLRKRITSDEWRIYAETDLVSSQRACYNLDLENGYEMPVKSWYWPDEVMEKVEEALKDYGDHLYGDLLGKKKRKEESTLTAEEQEIGTDEKLAELTKYLRSTYFYCVWCGAKFKGKSDIAKRCPGPSRRLH